MSLDILLQLHSIFYIGYLVVFGILITQGEKISAFFDKRNGKLAKVEVRRREDSKKSRFEP